MAQWLRFHLLTAGVPLSIPSQGAKIPLSMGHDQNETKQKLNIILDESRHCSIDIRIGK